MASKKLFLLPSQHLLTQRDDNDDDEVFLNACDDCKTIAPFFREAAEYVWDANPQWAANHFPDGTGRLAAMAMMNDPTDVYLPMPWGFDRSAALPPRTPLDVTHCRDW